MGRQAEEIVAKGDLLPDEFMLRVVASKLDELRDKHWILDGFPRTIGQGELLDTHLRYVADAYSVRSHLLTIPPSLMLPKTNNTLCRFPRIHASYTLRTHTRSTNTPLTLLVNLIIPTAILRARIANRWVHAPSGRVYNPSFNPPRVPGRDDVTGEPLIQRPDDKPDVFERRLRAYERETAPLLGYYAARAEGVGGAAAMGGVRKGGLRMVALEGETSDEIWPVLERTVRELFPSVRTREEVARVEEQALARRRGEPAVSRRDLDAPSEGREDVAAGASLAK